MTMSIQKLYRKSEDSFDSDGNLEYTKGGSVKKNVTWFDSYRMETVTNDKTGRTREVMVATGNEVKVKRSPLSMGDGIYYNADLLDKEELESCKRATFKRIATPRTITLLDAFDSLVNAVTNQLTSYTEEQANTILAAIKAKETILENALYQVKGDKEGNTIAL